MSSEFGRASSFRDRLLVVGRNGARRLRAALSPGACEAGHVWGASWPFLRRASDRYADAVADIVAAHGCRLVEVHNRAPLFHRLAQRLGPQIRLCLYLHNDPQTMEELRTPLERTQLLQRASLVYCLSSYIRDRFVDGRARAAERIVVLPNGIAPLPERRPPRQKTILFVGRLIPEKGVEELFDALRQLARELPDWRVVIIGRSPERHRRRYERRLADLKAIWGDRLVRMEIPAACAGHAGLRVRGDHGRSPRAGRSHSAGPRSKPCPRALPSSPADRAASPRWSGRPGCCSMT